MGPLHWQMLLLITSLWPIIFVEGTANSLRWAHCISGCCCQWLQFGLLFSGRHFRFTQMGPLHLQDCCRLLHSGPLYFSEALPMHSDGPIALVDAAANCFVLAQYISGRHC